ncbi:MAG: phosphate acyltransferase PlsX [Dehalococcoidia bacterium]|nr:phosphate acyltransferase PlsX [Dehalococcoidia bacterium]
MIALDAVGGDRAPGEAVAGAVEAARQLRIPIALVGPRNVVENELARHADAPRLEIVEAGQIIAMDEPPTQAVRQKRDASINVAMRMLKSGEADAVVSAGNTGALVASALLNLGRLPGIHRPAIGALLPSTEHGVLLLDAGANAECKPSYLVQFAYMGSAYMERMFGISRPRVGLLNIGEEDNKGNDLAQDVYPKLKKANLNFVGNVEGKDIARNMVDVVVTDGFTGNVAVKMSEASVEFVLSQLKRVLGEGFRNRLAALALSDSLRGVIRRLDYSEYGGVPLLGVNGIVIAAHGRSDAKAFKNALRIAREAVGAGILEALSTIPRK